jgi:1-acyl-sn-glycerol-3-phosphate acyltransferase
MHISRAAFLKHREFVIMLLSKMIVSAAVLSVLASAPAVAADPIHVRGTVKTVDGPKVTIATREGKEVSLVLGDAWKIGGVVKASMADIKQGTFIGTANVAAASGAKALEVVVFPEAMRGAGEGNYGWDLKPKSSMTNATVSTAVQGVDGQTVTLSYKGGQKKVTIAPDTPIVTFAPATAADIKPGAAVFIVAAGGTLDKGFIAVGKDGVVPPM